MARDVEAIETEFNGTKYRSRTEARWAVFFDALGVGFTYEGERVALSNGDRYVPDFYIRDFGAYFEVKGDSDKIVTEEARKARCLAADRKDQRVWLAIGSPSMDRPNILTLEQWTQQDPIEEILATPENRYYLLEDRRDERVYWLQADFIKGAFRHSFMVGGPGISTDHDRLPMNIRHVARAYEAARNVRW